MTIKNVAILSPGEMGAATGKAFQASGFKSLPPELGETAVMKRRHELQIHPRYRMVDSCAAEFAAATFSPLAITAILML